MVFWLRKLLLLILFVILSSFVSAIPTEYPDGFFDNEIGIYHFNESGGTTVEDSSGLNNDLTMDSAIHRVDSSFFGRGVANFTGTNSMDINQDKYNFNVTGSFCIWLNVTPAPSVTMAFASGPDGGTFFDYSNGKWRTSFRQADNTQSDTTYGNLLVNVNYHACVVWDSLVGNYSILYINGTQDVSQTWNQTLIGHRISASSFQIGNYVGGAQGWEGFIDDVLIFNDTLDSGEVYTIFNGNYTAIATPNITFINFTNEFGTFNYNTTVEYTPLNWTFVTEIANESKLHTVIYDFLNSSNDTLLSFTSNFSINITVNGTLFQDFEGNPFSLSVIANTTAGGRSVENASFITMNDTFFPVCSGFDNTTNVNNTNYQWDVNCTDNALFSLNVSCDNGFEFNIEGLSVTEYNFTNTTLILNDTICLYEACDGHSKVKIKKMLVTDELSKVKRTFDNKITVKSEKQFDSFDTTFMGDKHIFKIKFNKKVMGANFTVSSDEFMHIMDFNQYMGWIVTGDYYIDFENDNVYYAKASRISNNEVFIELKFRKEMQTVVFESIGKTNCISNQQNITSVQVVIPPLTEREIREFTSIPQALFWVFLTMFWFACLIASLTIRGDRGLRMGILIILQAIIGIVVGISWIQNFNFLVGIMILFTAIGVLAGSIGRKSISAG